MHMEILFGSNLHMSFFICDIGQSFMVFYFCVRYLPFELNNSVIKLFCEVLPEKIIIIWKPKKLFVFEEFG
uniref:Ovule protein n=1 Tax=Panagrolaimus sp. JU765 TaxID=591449 RepID=A0AC34PV07_9BILA